MPPLRFEDMKRDLRENRVIFLVSKSGYGATFTAIKLLWDYFQQGYTPRWLYWCREPTKGRCSLDFAMNFKYQFPPKSVTYYEDPFGKEFFGRDKIIGVSDFVNLLSFFKSNYVKKHNFFVIFSSSEEIFQEIENNHILPQDQTRFASLINIYSIEYDRDQKLQLLQKWGRFFGCNWTNGENFASVVAKLDPQVLENISPLFIRDLAMNSPKIKDDATLLEIIANSGADPVRLFAEDLKTKTLEEQYFIARSLIAPLINPSKAEERIEEFFHSHKIKRSTSYNNILIKYHSTRINVLANGLLELAHPSYVEALKYVLSQGSEFYKLFNQILFFLHDKKLCIHNVIWTILHVFNLLPPSSQEIAIQYVNDKKATRSLLFPILFHYKDLPENVQEVLFQLAQGKNHTFGFEEDVDWLFHRLPAEMGSKLLTMLSEDEESWGVSWTALVHYQNLTDNAKEIPFRLIKKSALSRHFALHFGLLYPILPPEIQALYPQFLTSKDTKESLAWGLAASFDNLPKDIQENFIAFLKEEDVGGHIIGALEFHFNSIPSATMERFINILAENPAITGKLLNLIIQNYDELSTKIHNLVFELADFDALKKKLTERKPRGSRFDRTDIEIASQFDEIARAILQNYADLPERIQDLIPKMMENAPVASHITSTIAYNFSRIPQEVAFRLLKLSAEKVDKKGLGGPANIIYNNYDAIPEPMRTQMVLESAQDPRDLFHVSKILVGYFDKLSPGLKDLFQQMIRDHRKAHSIAHDILDLYDPYHKPFSERKQDKEEVHVNPQLLAILFDFVKDPKVLLGVAGKIISDYRRLPDVIRKLILTIPDILRKMPQRDHWDLVYTLVRDYKKLPKEVQAIVFALSSINPSELAHHILNAYKECTPELQEILPRLFKQGPDSRKLAKRLFHISFSGWHDAAPEPILHQLLQILLARGETLGVLEAIIYNFNDVREEYKELLFSKAQDARYAGDLAVAIARNYRALPDQVRNLLPTLCDYPNAKKQVINVITSIYKELPEAIRNKIFELSRIDDLKGEVALAIFTHAESLPDTVIALLPQLESAFLEKVEEEFKQWKKVDSDWTPLPLHFGYFKTLKQRISLELLEKVLNVIEKYIGSNPDYQPGLLEARKSLNDSGGTVHT